MRIPKQWLWYLQFDGVSREVLGYGLEVMVGAVDGGGAAGAGGGAAGGGGGAQHHHQARHQRHPQPLVHHPRADSHPAHVKLWILN